MPLQPLTQPSQSASCIRCASALPAGTGLCAACGTVQRRGLLSRSREREAEGWSEGGIAAILAGFGALLHLGAAMAVGGSPGEALVSLLVTLALGLPLMIAAAVLVGGVLFKTSFGSLKTAIPKLAAVLLVPHAVALLVGGLLGWLLSLVLYYGLLTRQFQMELAEAWVYAFVCAVLEVFVIASVVATVVTG